MKTFDCNKPEHYIKFYESHIVSRSPTKLLEIGVQTGRSLRMWKRALPNARIIGLDVDEPTEELDEGIEFVQGDQTDESLLTSLGFFDVIIDDGSHMTFDQQKSYEILFPRLKSGGIYVIEDLEVNDKDRFQNTPMSTTEYFAEKLRPKIVSNAWQEGFIQEGIRSISFHENFLVIEKL